MKSNHLPRTSARRIGAALVVATLAALAATLDLGAQQVGPNVSVVTGAESQFAGDPFLQRQNEAVLAISTRNPDHLMVAMNDYSTVDIAFDPAPEGGNEGLIARNRQNPAGAIPREVRANASPEAWIGLAFSQNRGQHWYKALLPGFPQDTSAVGQSSPLYGLTAGTDPVLVAGPHGRFYLGGLAFDRDGTSRIFAAHFVDENSEEGGETIHYKFARVIHRGSQSSKGRFADKPSIGIYAGAAGAFSPSGNSKKGPKEKTVVVSGCERVYIAYTMFEGLEADGRFRSAVYVSYSASCGESWSNPVKINGPYSVGGTNFPGTRNQGTSIAIDPSNGHVYVVWRVFGPNGFVMVRSTDGGVTFSNPQLITGSSPVYAFDQPTVMLGPNVGNDFLTFRTNAYPSAVLDNGRLVVAWQERVGIDPLDRTTFGLPLPTGEPRIVATFGTRNLDGSITWSARRALDMGDVGLATPDGNVALNRRCEFQTPLQVEQTMPACRDTGPQVMPHVAAGDGQLVVFYYEGRGGLTLGTGLISGIDRQVDVRAALLDPTTAALIRSVQVSRYTIDSATGEIMDAPDRPLGPPDGFGQQKRKKVNHLNAPMYRGGLAPFAGDYPHLIPLRPDASGPGFRAVWTDLRDAVFPPNWDFTAYIGPWMGDQIEICNAGARDANIYSAEIGTGLVVGTLGNFKQLLDLNGQPVQRAFAIYVENHTAEHRAFEMTITNGTGISASFESLVQSEDDPLPPTPVPSVDVEVLAGSSITRTVYLSGAVATGSAVVTVQEIAHPAGTTPSRNLSASVTLNGDPTNPFVSGISGEDNKDLAQEETHNPQLGSPQLGSPQLGSPQLGSPQLGSPQLGSPQVSSPQVSSTSEGDALTANTEQVPAVDERITDITIDVENAGNTASGYNALVALLNAPELAATDHTFQVLVYRTHQTPGMDNCAQVLKQQDRLLFASPQLGSPQLGSPQLGSPQLGSPQLGSPQLGSPQLGSPQLASTSFSAAPADPSPEDHDGTIHEHIKRDVIKLSLRIFHPSVEEARTHDPEAEFLDNFAVAVQAQAANTGEEEPRGAGINAFIVTNTNDSGPGSLRNAILAANDEEMNPGRDAITFAIPGLGPHSIELESALPEITSPVSIDGATQSGYAGTPIVELNGASAGTPGLWISAGGSTVRGLAINRFSESGILITGGGFNVVVGNYIGTDLTGAEPSANGGNGILVLESPGNIIGGSSPASRNVISGNSGEGIEISGAGAGGNAIRGNYIGTSASGMADLGNGLSGIFIRRAPGTSVVGNVVSGNNGFAGIAICGDANSCGGDAGGAGDAAGTIIRANIVGVNASGSGPLGNAGLGLSIHSTSSTVAGAGTAADSNTIAFNGGTGVVVFGAPAAGNNIQRNSIHTNGGLGIDLGTVLGANGITLNDLGGFVDGDDVPLPPDSDLGPNGLQNFPVVQSAVNNGDGSTTIVGSLTSTPNTEFRIDLYVSAGCDPSGNGEGQTWLQGFTMVPTNAQGFIPWATRPVVDIPVGMAITATATSEGGSTSEFSACAVVRDASEEIGFLLFEVEPTNATGGQPIDDVQVRAFDSGETPLPGVSITMTLDNDPCGTSTLFGKRVEVTDENGIATFSDLRIDRGGSGYRLLASATDAAEVTQPSDEFHVTGFCGTGDANASRALYAAAPLADEGGGVLLTGGNDNEGNALSSAEVYDPATGDFSLTGSMSRERQEHTATLLPNGNILVVGGDASPSTAELYNPAAGVFEATGTPNDQHHSHTATLLNTGQVLIAGGASQVTAELYNPVDGVFTPTTGDMDLARPKHTATLLDDGRVLLTGGRDVTGDNPNLALTSTEIYDPRTGEFEPGPDMSAPRMDHQAVRLPDGRVLITGGLINTTTATATAEIYNPASDTFILVEGNMASDRASHTATVLEDGTVLIAGGFSTQAAAPLITAEIYDPASEAFTTTGVLVTARHSHAAFPLLNGTILLVGGWGVTGAELFYPLEQFEGSGDFAAAFPAAEEPRPGSR